MLLLTTLVLAFLLADLVPFGELLGLATSFRWAEFLGLNGIASYRTSSFAVSFAVALPVSHLFIRRATAAGAFRPKRAKRLLVAAGALVGLFLLLAPFAVTLSAIPYGGGNVPYGLYVLLYAAKFCAICGLATAILSPPQSAA